MNKRVDTLQYQQANGMVREVAADGGVRWEKCAEPDPHLLVVLGHRRFQEWAQAGVFEAFWRDGLLACDTFEGIDWTWPALDGAMGKAPLGGDKPAAIQPTAASAGSSARC